MGISNIRKENDQNQAQRWKCQFWNRQNKETMRKRYGDVNWGLYENPGRKTWIFFKKQEVRPFSKRDWLGQGGTGDLGRGKVKKGELLLMGKRVTVRHTCASLQGEGGWTAVSIKKQKRLSNDISLLLIGAGGVNRNPQSANRTFLSQSFRECWI